MSVNLELMNLCRLCLVKDNVNVPIFGEANDVKQLFLKITACLPVKVSRDDNLPKRICESCLYKVDLLYQFWNTTVNAEKQLLQWLSEIGVDINMKLPPPPPLQMIRQSHAHPHSMSSSESIVLKQEPQQNVYQEYSMGYPQMQENVEMKNPMNQVLPTEQFTQPTKIRLAKQKATKAILEQNNEPVDDSDNKMAEQNDDDDDDRADSFEIGPVTKMEEADSDDDDYMDEPSTLEPTAFVDVSASVDTDQPGPSGLAKQHLGQGVNNVPATATAPTDTGGSTIFTTQPVDPQALRKSSLNRTNLSRLGLESLLQDKAHKAHFSFKRKPNTLSKVWQHYEQVVYKGIVQQFCRCNFCNRLVSYKSATGTASLLRHAKLHEAKTMTMNFKHFEKQHKDQFAGSHLAFIACDLWPTDVTNGGGFKKMAQHLINIGSEFGPLDINDVFYSPRAVLRSLLPNAVSKIKGNISHILLTNSHIALSVDLWSDDYRKRNFITLNGHFLNETFDLMSFMFGTRELDELKSSTNLTDLIKNLLAEYVVDSEKFLKENVVITDGSTNAVNTLKSYNHYTCACQNLNLIVQDIIYNFPDEVMRLLGAVKKLVTYFKQTGLNLKLKTTLKQGELTNWSSLYGMVTGICDMYDDVKGILCAEDKFSLLNDIDLNLMKTLINFLSVFKDCSDSLSRETEPTINEMYLWRIKLLRHCANVPTDSTVLSHLKSVAKNCIENRFQFQNIHKIALFLDPNFKHMKYLSTDERNAILQLVSDALRAMKNKQLQTNPYETVHHKFLRSKANDNCGDISFKKFKSYHLEEFADWNLSCSDDNEVIDNEVTTYYLEHNNSIVNVLRYWQNNQTFPLLRQLARQTLHIPTSSTISERMFSPSGRLLEERRICIKSEHIDNLLFLHKNYYLLSQ